MPAALNFVVGLLIFSAFLPVHAGLFVVNPRQGSLCHGGELCTVDWLDDGSNPLLSAIGICIVGLYTGNQQLVQTIQPVDVSTQISLTFTPIPAAGPNSDAYYIAFISNSAKQNTSLPYAAFSPFFGLDQMTGSFATPDPSATISIPIPPSIIFASVRPTILSTTTVGTLSPSPTRNVSLISHPPPSPSITIPNPSSQSQTAVESGSSKPNTNSPSSRLMTTVLSPSSSPAVSASPSPSGSPSNSGATSDAPATEISRHKSLVVGFFVLIINVIGSSLILVL